MIIFYKVPSITKIVIVFFSVIKFSSRVELILYFSNDTWFLLPDPKPLLKLPFKYIIKWLQSCKAYMILHVINIINVLNKHQDSYCLCVSKFNPQSLCKWFAIYIVHYSEAGSIGSIILTYKGWFKKNLATFILNFSKTIEDIYMQFSWFWCRSQ